MKKLPRVILGLSYGHGDSSAALVVDGKLVAAVEEERFNRIKHYALFPTQAIGYCLKKAGLRPEQVDVVSIAKKKENARVQKFKTLLRYPHLLGHALQKKTSSAEIDLQRALRELGILAPCQFHEHHLAHLASVRFLLTEAKCALFSFDGLGDFVSAAMGIAKGHEIQILERLHYPHSVGFYYSAMTQFLGFPYFGDEFKVMGLSSYGRPVYLDKMEGLLQYKKGIQVELNQKVFPITRIKNPITIEQGKPFVSPLFNPQALSEHLGLKKRAPKSPLTTEHHDLAASIQRHFENIANQMLHGVFEKTGVPSLGLAGGCAHNSVWVGQIPERTPFRNIKVAAASHDAGIAVGAAVLSAQTWVTSESSNWALLGPSHTEEGSNQGLAQSPSLVGQVSHKTQASEASLIEWMVEKLTHGKIIGLFHGPMEFGPRALGSRSILADPREPQIKDKLNARIKHRESFRPFAASILYEQQTKWFSKSFFSPTMEAVFQVRSSQASRIPGVVHVDHSCRIQSVRVDEHPFFYKLLQRFYEVTGVPMLINTSFNDNEPIVCSQKDAMECFTRCEMDHLVMGLDTFSKPPKEAAFEGHISIEDQSLKEKPLTH